jgi:multiple sugar transport system permease protein
MVTWVLMNYINTIPKELDEAAFLDGYGRVRIFLNIILPNSYPIIFAVILMIFLMTWSQYQIPMILASSIDTKPLSMIVAEFTSKDSVQYGITAAAGILALLPPAVVAVIFRKSLILGMKQGSVKG